MAETTIKISELAELTEFDGSEKLFVERNNVSLKLDLDTIRQSITPTDTQVENAVDDWLTDHPEATTTVQDGSITYAKLASDTKGKYDSIGDLTQLNTTDKTSLVDAINEVKASGNGGLTNDIKEALLDCFEHVAWIDEDGQDYYDALHDALYPPANLSSITCVYTQSGTVYTTDSLDSLKSDLVVTAHYDDNSTQTITTYTLSGTLTEGTSTITVSYGGKTTTFTVTVTLFTTAPSIAEYDKMMGTTGVPSAKEGMCYTNPYSYQIDIDALKASDRYDATNNYMTGTQGNAYCIKYYIPDSNSISTSAGNKNVSFDANDNVISYSSITKNSLATFKDERYKSAVLTSGSTFKFVFTLFTADINDCYAYFDTPSSGVMPIGVNVGDIIFAGANTPYYGCRNISEAQSS